MRIAIVTSFRAMPENYSLVNDVKDRIKTLKRYGHEVVFFAQEGCVGGGITCEMKAILPHIRLEKDVVNEQGKKDAVEILTKELANFDLAFTDDLIYIRQYITYREALFEVAKNLPNLKWAHWAHSRISEYLKLKMPNAKYIFMNHKGAKEFASHIGVNEEDIVVIFNDKDARIFFEFDELTKRIIDKYDLMNYEVMQVYPMCTTRMNAKGVDKVINIFAEIKKRGKKVKLVICNSNANKEQWKKDIEDKYQRAERLGLIRDKDIVFTSTFSCETVNGVPRRVVRELMMLSNLFIFPSQSEVCSNVLLEASMTKNLLVLNEDFPPMFDFGDKDKSVLSCPFGSLLSMKFSGGSDGTANLVDKILKELENNKVNQQFLKIKDVCNIDTIYKKQFKVLLDWVKQK